MSRKRKSLPGKSNPNYRHGHSLNGGTTREYRAWYSMKRRCDNPNYEKYKHYGGRGIRYTPAWSSFANFLQDMGLAPDNTFTLERREVNADYSADNCYWATWAEQARNKRCVRTAEINGVTRLVKDWCEAYGVKPNAVYKRLRRGWNVVDAITTPLKSVTDTRYGKK